MNLKLIKIQKLKSGDKKYEAIFERNGKTIKRKFGAKGMSDFTIHKDKERREKYINRHKKDLRTNDPSRAGFLSMYILWNKPSFKSSLTDYKKRLNTYNKTGKFPVKITGSKVLKFGVLFPYKGTMFEKLPQDLFDEYFQKPYAADKIKRFLLDPKNKLKMQLYKMNKRYDENYTWEQFVQETPWEILNPYRLETSEWIFRVADDITTNDLKELFWYKTIKNIVEEIKDDDPHNNLADLTAERSIRLNSIQDNLELIFDKMGITIDFEVLGWYNEASEKLKTYIQNLENGTMSFGKIPDNVINKPLYERIKKKIKKDVDKKKRRWGAYDSGRLVREYKEKGGKYKGTQIYSSKLSKWYREKWIDACAWPKKKSCGRTESKEKIAYCRPSVKVDSKTPKLIQDLSKAEIKRRCKAKKGNPKKIIK